MMTDASDPTLQPCYKPTQNAARADIRLLIEQYPLAWVCAEGGTEACLLPLVGIYDEADGLIELIGHFSRANSIGDAVARDPRATILFTGPQGYISPTVAGRRNWAPTWNYAQVSIQSKISVESELTARSLELLIDHVESGRPNAWSSDELGERYDKLIAHIVGFRASVTELTARFKLGQDEKRHDLRALLSNLPDGSLKQWMQRCNRHRLVEGTRDDSGV